MSPPSPMRPDDRDLRDLLPLHALGLLEADDAARVEAALARDPALAAELRALEAAAVDLAPALAPAVPPPPAVLSRLLASTGGGQFEPFAARLATLFDVGLARARELLGLLERPASWGAEAPGVELVHFAGGPACAAADCGFVRLAPGAVFPPHRHVGAEVSVILAGQLHDPSTGRTLGPGDELALAADSSHHLVADATTGCVFAARAEDGIEIAGVPAGPRRPR